MTDPNTATPQAVNLCDSCKLEFATCVSEPVFEGPDDNVTHCPQWQSEGSNR
jgi:hypothetical protein